MKRLLELVLFVAICQFASAAGTTRHTGPGLIGTPENQVFQFVQEGSVVYPEGGKVTAESYLWIPEECHRLRGLLILCTNVPEHGLVGHPALRAVCRANDLGIVWSTPSFFNYANKDGRTTVDFLQRLLDGLAKKSGYEEVATVPWLPMAESAHLRMLYMLLNEEPGRCIAAIFMKNMPAYSLLKNYETPVLAVLGTAQEWYQDKSDIRTKWQDLSFYGNFLKQRTAYPHWPASLLIEGGSGHFEVDEAMVHYFADYISAAVKARLPMEPGGALHPVAAGAGFVVGMPLPGRDDFAPTAAATAAPARSMMPWFFNEDLAGRARGWAAINWSAATQFPAFVDAQGKPVPKTYQGITSPVPVVTGADGITFEVKGCLLPTIPVGFVGAGAPLAAAPGEPRAEWVCGAIAPLGEGKFRIALDRTWPKGPVCVVLRHQGTDEIRDVVQPGYISLKPNMVGTPQTITFNPIVDQVVGTDSVPLVATADSGMPVRFFVVAGPARIDGSTLVLLPTPPRTHFPVEITVTAWQWGRSAEPRVQTAATVTHTFHLWPKATRS